MLGKLCSADDLVSLPQSVRFDLLAFFFLQIFALSNRIDGVTDNLTGSSHKTGPSSSSSTAIVPPCIPIIRLGICPVIVMAEWKQMAVGVRSQVFRIDARTGKPLQTAHKCTEVPWVFWHNPVFWRETSSATAFPRLLGIS